MTVDDLLKYYEVENDHQLHKKTGFAKSTISTWRANGIGETRQTWFEKISSRKLKADINHLQDETA